MAKAVANQKVDAKSQYETQAAYWAAKITTIWQRAVQDVFEVGQNLIDAKDKLEHGQFEGMIEGDLPFGPSTAQRLMAIARDKKLTNPAHVQLLPASWGTLYALSQLPDDAFNKAVQSGAIKPDMQRADVQALRIETKPPPKTVSVHVKEEKTPPKTVSVHVKKEKTPPTAPRFLRELRAMRDGQYYKPRTPQESGSEVSEPAKLSADAFIAATHEEQEAYLDAIGLDRLCAGMSVAMRELLVERAPKMRKAAAQEKAKRSTRPAPKPPMH